MKFVLKSFCVSILLLLPFALMAGEAESQTTPDPGRIINFQLENDLFGGGTDRHYTHGSRISVLSSQKLTDFEEKFKDQVFSYLPEYFQPDTRRIGFILGQNMFTPEDISRSDLIEDDQPYAGWLYMGVSLVAEKSSGERPYLDNLEINFGMIGPAAQAEVIQTEVHRLKGVQLPNGWEHQLENEPGFVLYYERKWPLRAETEIWGVSADLTPSAGFALGNVYTYGTLGATVRIGSNLPGDYGPPLIRPGLSGSGFFTPDGDFSWYVFAGVQGRAVGRNIFLDGNSFQKSHSVNKKILVGDLQVGFMITFYEHFRLGFTNVFRMKEFKGQNEGDEFGSINLSIRW
jgi:hypothetical protein